MKPGAPLLALLLVGATVGCATREDRVETPRSPVPVEVASAEPAPAPAETPADLVGRPRLSRTITLGQQNGDPTYAGDRPAPPAREAGPSVVVNNQVVIQNSTPAYGYGYGYGRGGYGYGGYGSTNRGDGFGTRGVTAPAWGQSGFEGARRTAAPGQTPAVGGNWAPAPSYGPASMR